MNDPFKISGPTCISFSGGRSSAYMLWRVLQSNGGILPFEASVYFANTGKEDEATLRFVRDCAEQWFVPIHWVEYRASEPGFAGVDFDSASRDGEPFEALIEKKQYLPNVVERFCTQYLKVIPIRKCSRLDEDETMIGARADEPARVVKFRARGMMTPLAAAGITKADIKAYWQSSSFDLGLPNNNGITPLGNCDMCFLKGLPQLMSIAAALPAKPVWWARMEKNRGARFAKDRPSYAQMLKNVGDQTDAFGHDEEAISCYCGE